MWLELQHNQAGSKREVQGAAAACQEQGDSFLQIVVETLGALHQAGGRGPAEAAWLRPGQAGRRERRICNAAGVPLFAPGLMRRYAVILVSIREGTPIKKKLCKYQS